MNEYTSPPSRIKSHEWWLVCALQILFLIISLYDLNAPLTSAHYVRQNQTFDMARHVFHEGWSAVINPKVSFTAQEALQQPYTVVHLEVPFHGLLGWPVAVIFKKHEYAIARLVSVLFGMLSIALCYRVLRHWLESPPSLAGTALWATAPMILHFGQVPMPDIIATTGMIAAFAFALRGNLLASSASFLFMILAKASVIVYGLPILTALLVAKQCDSFRQFIRLSLAWGSIPLLGLLAWIAISRHDPPGSWELIGGPNIGERGTVHLQDLLRPSFYLLPVINVFGFGCGVIGTIGLIIVVFGSAATRMSVWIRWSILGALGCYYLFERITWLEPQYTPPALFWVVVAASFGLGPLFEKMRSDVFKKLALGTTIALHITLTICATFFLKAHRVSNIQDIQAASQYIPQDARVIVWARILGTTTSPPIWLDRNTFSLQTIDTPMPWESDDFNLQVQQLQSAGYRYLAVFDVDGHHSRRLGRGMTRPHYETNFAVPQSPFRNFCDARFQKIYEGEHIVLYLLSTHPSMSH